MKEYLNRTKSWWEALKWTARAGVILIAVIVAFGISSTVKNILYPYKEIIEKWRVIEKPVIKYKTVTKTIPIEIIKEKERVIEKLKLPDWAKEKEILGTTSIAPSESKTEVAALLDPQSGETSFIARQLPRPFLDFRQKFSVGIDYSPFHSSNLGDYRLNGEWEAGRVWNIKPIVRGEVDQKSNWRVSVGLKYEF